MRIGIFDPYFDTLGGGEKYVLDIAQCLSKDSQVDIFWDSPQDVIKKRIKERFDINVSQINFVPNIFSRKSSLIERFLATSSYDVFFFVSDGSIPSLFAKKNILIFQFPINWVAGKDLLTRIKFINIHKVFCYSYFVKKFIDDVLPKESKVLSPYIDSKKSDSIKKENIILSVGRFTQAMNQKKQEVLIDAFKKMCDRGLNTWKLVLIGSVLDKDKEFVGALITRSKSYPIEIHKNVPFKELLDYYDKAKIYWHAAGFGENLERYPERAEHFGITTLEAMSSGSVPVVINAGGQREIVTEGENGFLWDSLDELIEKTELLLKDEKLWEKVSKKAVLRSKDFSKDHFCLELNSLLNEK